jgi:hypothetical protein
MMNTNSLLFAGVTFSLLVAPTRSSAQVGSTAPDDTTVLAENATVTKETRSRPPPNRILLGTGALLFVPSYVTSVFVGATSTRDSNDNLFIPVVGPWIALANRDCTATQPCEGEFLSGLLLVLDGAVQTAGVLTMGAAFLLPERVTTINIGRSAKMTVAPAKLGPAGYGLTAVGEF